jgi:hypothetical protein
VTAPDRVAVRLLGFPLQVYLRALEHSNELMREFSLIAMSRADDDRPPLPKRLVQLVERLTHDYAGVTDEADAQRDEALEAGLESVDLIYLVPPAAGEASRVLGAMLDEADDYCRNGGTLLTLATPAEAKRFRDWYLGEFIGQVVGAEPTPWPDFAGTAPTRR